MLGDVQPNPVYAEGRRCTHADDEGVRCITLLCRMNPGPKCFVHTLPAVRREEEPARRRLEGAFAEVQAA